MKNRIRYLCYNITNKDLIPVDYQMTDASAETAEYGIALVNKGKPVVCIPCISTDRAAVMQLTALLNEMQIEPCHFTDIIEDYLTDFTV